MGTLGPFELSLTFSPRKYYYYCYDPSLVRLTIPLSLFLNHTKTKHTPCMVEKKKKSHRLVTGSFFTNTIITKNAVWQQRRRALFNKRPLLSPSVLSLT